MQKQFYPLHSGMQQCFLDFFLKASLPGKLNSRIFYYFASVRRLLTKGCRSSKDECQRKMEDQKKYKDTILKILESNEFPNIEEHAHADLMKDLKNLIREEVKSLKIKLQ